MHTDQIPYYKYAATVVMAFILCIAEYLDALLAPKERPARFCWSHQLTCWIVLVVITMECVPMMNFREYRVPYLEEDLKSSLGCCTNHLEGVIKVVSRRVTDSYLKYGLEGDVIAKQQLFIFSDSC